MRPTIMRDEDVELLNNDGPMKVITITGSDEDTLNGTVTPVEALAQLPDGHLMPTGEEWEGEEGLPLQITVKVALNDRDIGRLTRDRHFFITFIGDDIRPFVVRTREDIRG